MNVAVVITFVLQQAHALYCHSRPDSLRDNILGECLAFLVSGSNPTCHDVLSRRI